MSQIQISILDEYKGTITTFEVPDDVPISRLLPALLNALKLPMHLQGGNKINYCVNRKGHFARLGNHETFKSAGLVTGDILTLQPEVTAGGGIFVRSFRDIQIIDTYFNRDQVDSYHNFAVYAIILYTDLDRNFAKFIRENFLELHHLAGNNFAFYLLERPNQKWLSELRKELDAEISPYMERVWDSLGNDQFSPVSVSSVYEIAKRLKIERSQLPCIAFFSNLKSRDLLVVPFSSLLEKPMEETNQQEFLVLFRNLVDKIDIAVRNQEETRLRVLAREINRLKKGQAISKIEGILLPEAIKTTIGAVIKLLIA